VSASHDMFCLGLLAYETIAQQQAFPSAEDALACAHDQALYPWCVHCNNFSARTLRRQRAELVHLL
jgi:hypothetical protein